MHTLMKPSGTRTPALSPLLLALWMGLACLLPPPALAQSQERSQERRQAQSQGRDRGEARAQREQQQRAQSRPEADRERGRRESGRYQDSGPRRPPPMSHYGQRRDDDRRGAGPGHAYYRGGRLPLEYRNHRYVVDDWRGHRLQAPPRGTHWVQSGGDYLLVAVATGVILQLLLQD